MSEPETDPPGDGEPPEDDELLVEQAASAYRETRPDGTIADSPAWHDLEAAARVRAFERAVWLRRIEAALDPENLSSTGRAVLDKIRRRR